MGEENLLGEFVRARRELVTPELAGIPVSGVRRVPGLRREEVAMLAGISADYYLRLEQGRDRNPSVQVLESLARVLLLDDAATEYLLRLAAAKPKRTRTPGREKVRPSTAKLLESLGLPAFVESRYLDVLAANSLAVALSPRLAPGTNRLRDMFLDPAEQALYPDWERDSVSAVAGFRKSVGTDTDDPRYIEIVGELSLASSRFSRIWARHDVLVCAAAPMRVDHPQVGDLVLNRERLGVEGSPGQALVILHPDPGSDSAEKLTLLASSAAGSIPPTRREAHNPADR
ncbi:helix-turn-helix domain-containing protein [Saccharopolyspora dendranthemae]|uniref:Transcriptional regulator with XRE-family HTH domain n=1 Tax=Saccharopolyspora dendranthemae TaxID=1181886 RepID=A0A561V9Q7_9PSEU|nr:helix-turn-helix transcriptional regulator [Saccharopolyspora dendranthemae]TWG08355.1 transcriptional regulator with XRE-family HTH domain [Saccharopolyspora dendranthemae]